MRVLLAACCAMLMLVSAGWAEKKKAEPNSRTVQGSVTDAQDQAVNGAVVQLKNTKSLQIRSFITRDKGAYFFNGLSTDVDYELRADDPKGGNSSGTKTLSSFDSRKQAVINLKLTPKK